MEMLGNSRASSVTQWANAFKQVSFYSLREVLTSVSFLNKLIPSFSFTQLGRNELHANESKNLHPRRLLVCLIIIIVNTTYYTVG